MILHSSTHTHPKDFTSIHVTKKFSSEWPHLNRHIGQFGFQFSGLISLGFLFLFLKTRNISAQTQMFFKYP